MGALRAGRGRVAGGPRARRWRAGLSLVTQRVRRHPGLFCDQPVDGL